MSTETLEQARSDRDHILSVEDVTVEFDMDRGVSTVLDGATIDVRREEILGVVGESGSGKSMFADSLLDAVVEPGQVSGSVEYYPPDGGESIEVLELSDEELKEFRWEKMSMVFQGAMSSWNPTMKLRAHFEETIEAHDTPIDVGMKRAYRLLEDLYLDADRVLDSYPHELSGGMKQRALIALSLVLEPEVLVMDEPTASLDLLMQRSIINLLNDLQEEYGLTMVFISHNLPLVANLSDRIAVLYAFQLAEVGPTREIIENASHPYTRLLLESTPNLDAPLDEMDTISGSSPDPINIPEGCRFHTRCPLATNRCRDAEPEMRDVDGTHTVACYHWEDAAREIPISFDYREQEHSIDEAVPPDGRDPVVELDDVSIEFEMNEGVHSLLGGTSTLRAVEGVDLDVYENDVVAVVGESGCGKTTLGKTLIGIHRPAKGSVSYRGQDVWEARDGSDDATIPFEDIRLALQMIHQDPGSSLNPNKRVKRTLSKPLHKMHPQMSREERQSQILTMLEHVGMTPPEDYADRYPHQLSGGEKQRVALIRALFMNPDLILADEAVSALDVSLRVEMMDLFLELQDVFDTSFVFISHDLSNARYLAEKADGRIAVMYLGEIVEIGPAEQVIQNPQHPYTKALIWATPDFDPGDDAGELPVRSIDIPDPADPPSGCRFHTRCPDAREICGRERPDGFAGANDFNVVSCFRADPDHEYWDSAPLPEDAAGEETGGDAGAESPS
ncbi:ABC transporter ATP-binding protein [Halosimplex sp. TS25]|uniref:ABC transporter ATP-binding protein n=1 Tax=Halosimplex rarum TaxID=3396619 RepID=UPI0039ED9A0F